MRLSMVGNHAVTPIATSSETVGLAGGPLPVSYRRFMAEYGYGRLADLFIVYQPDRSYGDSLNGRGGLIRQWLLEAITSKDFYFDPSEYDEPDRVTDIAPGLHPFAVCENGGYLAWRLDQWDGAEYPVYYVCRGFICMRRAGADMDDLIATLTGERVRVALGPGYSPLPATFEPLERNHLGSGEPCDTCS